MRIAVWKAWRSTGVAKPLKRTSSKKERYKRVQTDAQRSISQTARLTSVCDVCTRHQKENTIFLFLYQLHSFSIFSSMKVFANGKEGRSWHSI